MTIEHIQCGFLGGNIGLDDNYDIRQSCQNLARLTKAALEVEHPEATIEVNYQVDASGSLPYNCKTVVNYEQGTNDCQAVDDITHDVWQDFDKWAVGNE